VVRDPFLDFERDEKAATMRGADEQFSPGGESDPLN
jgi:hypothetical protein